MGDTVGTHSDLHSEQGALPGEHRGRARIRWRRMGHPRTPALVRGHQLQPLF